MSISKILSKDEVDMLLDTSAVDGQDGNASGAASEAYFFSEHAHYEANDYIMLESIDEAFCQSLVTKLSHLSSFKVSVEPGKREIISFEEYIKSLEKPCLINYLSMQPLSGSMFFVQSCEMVAQWIEGLFGGNIESTINRTCFAKMDYKIGNILAEIIISCLTTSWGLVHKVNFQKIKTVSNPATVNVINEQEAVMVTRYFIYQDDFKTDFTLCIPMSNIKPILSVLLGEKQDGINIKESSSWKKTLENIAFNTNVKITAIIEKINMPLNKILTLKVNDIIPITNPLYADIYVDNLKLFKSKCGKMNGSQAIIILDKTRE